MINFAMIFLGLTAGFLCRRLKAFPGSSAQSFNAFVIYLSLPAVIFSQVPVLLKNMSFEGLWWVPTSMPWMMLGLSFLFFHFLGKKLGWSMPLRGALILTGGLANTSFVGFPLLEAIMGPSAIPVGILVDQPGSFLALSTLGIVIAASYSGNKVTPQLIAKRVLTFPPLICLVLSFFWFLAGSPGHGAMQPLFDKVGLTLVPLALFAVGFQLRFEIPVLRRRWQPLAWGLGFKLLLIPMLFFVLYFKLLKSHDFATHVTWLESAMAPMITAAVVASEFHLDSEMSNLMVGIGIPLSVLTVTMWSWCL